MGFRRGVTATPTPKPNRDHHLIRRCQSIRELLRGAILNADVDLDDALDEALRMAKERRS